MKKQLTQDGILSGLKPPSAIEQRLMATAAGVLDDPTPRDILFQHTVFCQTCLPFRDPGDSVRRWERQNGAVHLEVNAGRAMHPKLERFVDVPLPFGPKSRLVLMHINQMALQQKNPEIEMDDSLTRFVTRTLQLDSKGRNIRMVKDQLARLSASSIRLGMAKDGQAVTLNTQVIKGFELWTPKNENQRILWPSTVKLSLDYWESLKSHAVPLDERHISALSHSALALDIYTWLANRLHRIAKGRPTPLSWQALHAQFGQGYNSITKFRQVFRVALKEVVTVYREARVEEAPHNSKPHRSMLPTGQLIFREDPAPGLLLYNSKPPVSSK